MNLFSATAQLESVAIDIQGELICTPRGHSYILVITERFTKLVKAIRKKGRSTGKVARLLVEHWGFNYRQQTNVLSTNRPKFTSQFFQDVCRIVNTEKPFTVKYNPQTIGQAERYHRTILASLPSQIKGPPRYWGFTNQHYPTPTTTNLKH